MSDDLIAILRQFEGRFELSDNVGSSDFLVCIRAADEIQRLRAALMCCVQYDNMCNQTGRSCRDDAPCRCQLEAETWRMVAKDPGDE